MRLSSVNQLSYFKSKTNVICHSLHVLQRAIRRPRLRLDVLEQNCNNPMILIKCLNQQIMNHDINAFDRH